MREMGIALATAISAWLNAFLLYMILKIRDHITLDTRLISHGFKTLICSIVMGCACYFLNLVFFLNMTMQSAIINVGALIFVLMICKIIYIAMIFMLKVLRIDEIKGYIKK